MRIQAAVSILVLLTLRLLGASWAGAEISMKAEELEITRLTNAERVAVGIPPAASNLLLVATARQHSKEMMELGYFGHESPVPGLRLPWDRVATEGAVTSRVSENIFEAEGYPISAVPRLAIRHWMSSHGHRVNVLESRNVNMGVGLFVRGEKVTVTQVFCGEITQP